MYGLVIESIVAYIRKTYGDDKWMEIRKHGKVEQHSFSTHLIYPETTIPRLVETAAQLCGVTREDLLTDFGRFFVTFVSQYGYDKILRVLGRHMRDFLNGLDNLHEYMRFSYPKLRPPSFFVEKETEHGLVLHYRSKRRYGGSCSKT
ncbi:putative Soluble guanylate cyclase 88E [Hypsibius exemplaris]|uniref:Soluble guanylate cyclase 88E n=1 Tax=Hypsibius exemplaris TaxID=2072580 RepID=A0A1W0WAL5_HYPEX|nr:putative Soluble guanylate cyclase 88E [Hypsibius exemplaris]